MSLKKQEAIKLTQQPLGSPQTTQLRDLLKKQGSQPKLYTDEVDKLSVKEFIK